MKLLSLEALLCLPMVCRALRQATRGRGDPWFRMVSRKVRTDKPSAWTAVAHKRFFGIPAAWKISDLKHAMRIRILMGDSYQPRCADE